MLEPKSPAPDFVLQTVDGEAVSLTGMLREGGNVLLVFLRHLG